MNNANEIVHNIHIVNQMLHDAFVREYNHVVGEHEEDMDKALQIMTLNPSI